MELLVLLIFVNIDLIFSQYQCPNNVEYESIVGCDPEAINPCTAGYRCRPANNRIGGGGGDGIIPNFVESGHSPTAVPIIPLGPLKGVVMKDNLTSQLASIEGVGADFAPNIGVIPSGLTLLQVGSFSILDTVAFDYPPSEGGFLHFLVAIDPLYIPSAIYLYYNYPSFGESVFNLTESNQRFDRGYNYIIGNATIVQQTQLIHIHNWVL
uniref:Uncharacterized protein n=1 Tax=Panagrolaimus superbus TaxID=310955 RepID=A0A914ZCX1_9BILA